MEHADVGRGCRHRAFDAVAHSGSFANAQLADVFGASQIR